MNSKIIATIEARMTSSRLPGKVLMDLGGKPSLQQMIERIRKSELIHDIVVATTTNKIDDSIVELCKKINCSFFRGSETDVLSRVLGAAHAFQATHVVGLTGDCPLIDPSHIDQMIENFFSKKYDYVSNRISEGLPDGFDVQVYSVTALEKTDRSTKDPIDRSHVTCFMYQNPKIFKIGSFAPSYSSPDYAPELTVTLDEVSDYQLLQKIFEYTQKQDHFVHCAEIVALLKNRPELRQMNAKVTRKKIHEG